MIYLSNQPGLVVFRKLQSDAVKPERERDIDFFIYVYIYIPINTHVGIYKYVSYNLILYAFISS